MRCAYDLTEPARKRIEAERDAEIAAKKAEGKSTRAVAREMDLPQRTVQDVVERNSHRAKSAHQDDPPAEIPGQALHDDMTSPRGERWWGALRALQKVDQQASVEATMMTVTTASLRPSLIPLCPRYCLDQRRLSCCKACVRTARRPRATCGRGSRQPDVKITRAKAGPSINGFMILPSGEEIAETGRTARRGAGHDRALRRHRRRRFLPPWLGARRRLGSEQRGAHRASPPRTRHRSRPLPGGSPERNHSPPANRN